MFLREIVQDLVTSEDAVLLPSAVGIIEQVSNQFSSDKQQNPGPSKNHTNITKRRYYLSSSTDWNESANMW